MISERLFSQSRKKRKNFQPHQILNKGLSRFFQGGYKKEGSDPSLNYANTYLVAFWVYKAWQTAQKFFLSKKRRMGKFFQGGIPEKGGQKIKRGSDPSPKCAIIFIIISILILRSCEYILSSLWIAFSISNCLCTSTSNHLFMY